jgi:enoyl-CoA hydratase/carnithine racemase
MLDDYLTKYSFARMRRADGILEVVLHTDGGPLVWGEEVHRLLGEMFAAVGSDSNNRVIILTGSGDTFCSDVAWGSWDDTKTPEGRNRIYMEGRRLHMQFMEMSAPVITAVNGPAHQHAELAVMGDIVLAADTASFQDTHFSGHGRVPGDGSHVVWQLLLGINRAKYFHLTGRVMGVEEALALGVVNEVLPPNDVLPRAWELAQGLSKGTDLLLQYSRIVLNLRMKRAMESDLGFGLTLENLAAVADHFGPQDLVRLRGGDGAAHG